MSPVNAAKQVDFYYDFSCPYAYLAHTQIEQLCERAGATLVWRPFLLGGVFRAIGAPMVPAETMPAAKSRLNDLDMVRWADHFGVPLNRPASHPNRTVLALRAAIASGDIPRASKAMFRAYWDRGLDISRPEVVRAALDEAGFDSAEILRRVEEPAVKDDLKARTDAAISAGVFGAPTFVVTAPGSSGDLLWGQDRLLFVEKALGGVQPSAQPRASTEHEHPRELFFYFDFSSPFAYLGATQVEAVAARSGAVVRYRPFLLGGLFKDIGTPNVPLFDMPEAKRKFALADMTRWADHYGVPLRFPQRFPMNTVKPLRMILALPEEERRALVLPIFSAYWAEDRDIADDAVLHDIVHSVGMTRVDADTLLQRTRDEGLKARLKAATDDARALGVCGAPSFLVGDQLFWGQDRLVLVEKALNGWRPATKITTKG